jgi:hypothetical protein
MQRNELTMTPYLTLLIYFAFVLFPILIPLAVTFVHHAGPGMRRLTAALRYRRIAPRQRVLAWRAAAQAG